MYISTILSYSKTCLRGRGNVRDDDGTDIELSLIMLYLHFFQEKFCHQIILILHKCANKQRRIDDVSAALRFDMFR